MVDRGPDSPAVIRFFLSTPNAASILGNHERKHMRAWPGDSGLAPSQILARDQFSPEEYAQAVEYMRTLPHILDLDDAILVHGFLEPRVSLEEQDERVVVGTLGGQRYLERTYSRRSCELYDRKKPVIVGHLDYTGTGQPLIYRDRVFGIDTGCCRGGRLTGILLPEFRILQVSSKKNYWAEAAGKSRKLGHRTPPCRP
jgi:serine/threonine protein phosphatase 1